MSEPHALLEAFETAKRRGPTIMNSALREVPLEHAESFGEIIWVL